MARLLPIAFALALLAAFPSPARAQEGADRAERLRLARERWAKMEPEDRSRVLRNFEKWRRLSPDRREELRRRFDGLGGRDGAALLRERMKEAPPERLALLRMQAEAVRRLEERLVEGLPADAAARFAALPEEERERCRRRFARRLLEVGREDMVRRHATEEERRALDGEDPAARRAALQAVLRRTREEVLAPHREDIAKLPEGERRRREFLLMEERFRQGVARRFEEERAALLKAFFRGAVPGPGRGLFEREFGVRPEAVGARWARPLAHAARALPPEEREAWLGRVRPELLRIAALPEAERDAAMRTLLRSLRDR